MNSQTSLAAQIRACRRCPLGGLEGFAVPAEVGNSAPLLGFLLEAPGQHEAATSRPLVGKAGQVFDLLLEDAGLQRSEVLIMNSVRCRPPNNRLTGALGSAALEACKHWTLAEFEAYNPKVVVLMGATAIHQVFSKKPLVGKVRGMVRGTTEEFEYGKRLWVPTYHPAAILRPTGRGNRRLVVEDLKLAKELLYGN